MFNKLKQFKNLKSQASQLKSALAEEKVEGSSGFGKVKVVMDGNLEMRSITIDPDLLNIDDKEKLQNLVKDATNEAAKKAQKLMAEKMRSMGGLDIPGM